VQGYHISRALPADQFSAWLVEWEAGMADKIEQAKAGKQAA
jgi:hypothetical protein